MSLVRLTKDYKSYNNELISYKNKLDQLTSTQQYDINNDNLTYDVRRLRDYIDECNATITDIRHRLIDSIQQLNSFIKHNNELNHSDELPKANNVLTEANELISKASI